MNPLTRNQSITPQVRAVVESLDRFVTRDDVAAALRAAQHEALQTLQRNAALPAAFVALDVVQFGASLPAAVGSIRVVVTRDSGGDAVERHANSTQYLCALGFALETHVRTPQGWHVDRYGAGDVTELADRWHVVAPGVWHRSVAPGAQYWAVAALHSASEVSDEYE